ncbi:glycosyltransferase [Aminipila luticellarii]|uniref:Glycosyltransferase n=1 Tax=Aminipila luticellarii TaxID=2507160 RepID=A0A410PSE5_9FIRM|nr:glycosyltransferase [Aminipila luticellarii]QAT41911.1 glycosyltransferase [Aminipila luticellarii]
MFLSIIIPVLNIEKYIKRCLDSVLEACFDDCEIILVTGASVDKSNEICDEYQSTFSNIKLVGQNGKGLSNARNCALDVAMGKYIVYIDGDDYVDSELFRKLLETLRATWNDMDLIATDFRRIAVSSGKSDKIENVYQIGRNTEPQYGIGYLSTMLQKKHCFWNVWRYIYSREFLQQNNIRFVEGKFSEDIDYTTKVLIARPKMVFVHCPFYYYSIGKGDSLMDCPSYKQLRDTLEFLCNSIRMLEKSSFMYSQILIGQYQFEYILNIAIIKEVPKEEIRKARLLYKETLEILLVGSDLTAHLVKRILHIVPLSMFAEILHRLKLFRRFIKRGSGKKQRGEYLDDNH